MELLWRQNNIACEVANV